MAAFRPRRWRHLTRGVEGLRAEPAFPRARRYWGTGPHYGRNDPAWRAEGKGEGAMKTSKLARRLLVVRGTASELGTRPPMRRLRRAAGSGAYTVHGRGFRCSEHCENCGPAANIRDHEHQLVLDLAAKQRFGAQYIGREGTRSRPGTGRPQQSRRRTFSTPSGRRLAPALTNTPFPR